MLTIYQSDTTGRLQAASNIEHNTLLYFVNPTNEEIFKTANTLGIPEDFFRDPLDIYERPRIEKNGNALLIVLNLPVAHDAETRSEEVPYRTMPIGIIHAQNQLAIITREEVPLLADLFAGKYGSFQTHMKTRIILLLFEAIANGYVDFLKLITERVGHLQLELKKAYRNRELFGLIHLNKSLVYFSTSLRAMQIVFQRLSQGNDIKLYKEDERMLHDALVDLQQAAEITEMRRESLSNLMDAYATIVHNNLNSVLKILTAITIVMMIPTMIGSIFSMNVSLPHEGEWITTIVVGGLMAVISGAIVFVFYKTKFLR